MKIEKTFIDDILVIFPDVFQDDRGYFYESYNESILKSQGFEYRFVQDNISFSQRNTLRGLHYQAGEFAQGKLCSVLKGCVIDTAVDIRFNSPTFGRCFQIELSDDNHTQLWIPPGFAHGFSVISDEVLFSYKCTNLYNKASERTIIYNDIDLNIDWKIKSPIVSDKDKKGKSFSSIEKDFIYEKLKS